MRNQSHIKQETQIGILQRHVQAWRHAEGWSRESVVQAIVEAHAGTEFITNITFESANGRDAFTVAKTNADRVYRWLDDTSKDKNLLPANFIPSILRALPLDRRIHCANELLAAADLASHAIVDDGTELDVAHILQVCLKESSEAHQSIAKLIHGATHEKLLSAQREITEAIDALRTAQSAVGSAIAQASVSG